MLEGTVGYQFAGCSVLDLLLSHQMLHAEGGRTAPPDRRAPDALIMEATAPPACDGLPAGGCT
jgi:hypothetical protein